MDTIHNKNETLWQGIFPEEEIYQIKDFLTKEEVKFVNVFKGFKYMENKYTKNFSKKFFENTEEIKDYINEKLRRNKL